MVDSDDGKLEVTDTYLIHGDPENSGAGGIVIDGNVKAAGACLSVSGFQALPKAYDSASPLRRPDMTNCERHDRAKMDERV